MRAVRFNFKDLPVSERIQLVEDIWDSIAEEAPEGPRLTVPVQPRAAKKVRFHILTEGVVIPAGATYRVRTPIEQMFRGDGFQKVVEFRSFNGQFPYLRLKHPETSVRRLDIEKLAVTALPFHPPAAVVNNFVGALEFTSDSIWFKNTHVWMPGSKAAGSRFGWPGNISHRIARMPLFDRIIFHAGSMNSAVFAPSALPNSSCSSHSQG